MFKCEFSGEISTPATYRFMDVEADYDQVSSTSKESKSTAARAKMLANGAEKPVRLVVETRQVKYYDQTSGLVIGEGTEIVKEILVRPQHVDAAKRKFGLA